MAAGGLLLGALIGQAMPALKPLERGLEYTANSFYANVLPTIGDLVDLLYKNHISETEYLSLARQLGYEEKYSSMFLESARKILSEGDLLSGWRREIFNEEYLNVNLQRLHYDADTIEYIKKVSEYIPTPSDLIRFAVREVYSPDVTSLFGQFDDFPIDFEKEALKLGIQKETARQYWAAHWELPSITQGYEMLHRRVIDESTLDVLLRAHDVMPFWREKLKEISFNPLTRVDVRRMYSLGVIDRDAVFNNYLDLGYNEINAELMTEFTVKYESKEDLGLTASKIINSYKDDLITDVQAINYLKQLGYVDNIIELYMQQADYDKYEQEVKIYVEDLKQQYRLGIININELRTILNSLDLPSIYVSSVINKELVQQSNKIKIPSKTEVDLWLSQNLITELEYSNYLLKQGYQENDIVHYLESINIKIDTAKREYLSIEVYKRWAIAKIISIEYFINVLKDNKISDKDIESYVNEVQITIKETGVTQ